MAEGGDSVGSGRPCKTPEELAAKAIAPVKSDFLRSPLTKPSSTAAQVVVSHTTDSEFSLKEKKSKRQLKKERKEERKSVVHLCPEIARKGRIDSCIYGDGCRFSHDLEAFKSQKPPDLEGDCPFTAAMVPCPYGVACRFFGTHHEEGSSDGGGVKNGNTEMNGLKKEIQKLLWKNKMDFPRAAASLIHLDLPVHQTVCKKQRSAVTDGSSGSGVVGGIEFECDETDSSLKDHWRERKLIDFTNKLYLAPLTTVGNLPFRRVCKMLGADVTCGEMAMCTNLLQGQASEWALLRRHSSEDMFGVQICGAYPDTVARAAELIESECIVDFIDINMGCPIDIVVNKGAGSALLMKPTRMANVVRAASRTTALPITIKVRTGYVEGRNRIDSMITDIEKWGAIAVTIHGRSRQQRYNKLADWDYVYECSRRSLGTDSLQVLGNGDILSYADWNRHRLSCPSLTSMVVARGALIKPWIFTEVKEQRDWDIRSRERLDVLRDYVRFGLHHWGSDSKGVETTRYFLLEWLSYLHRYIPVALLDILPQQSNWRAPSYFGRDDLETLMASDSAADWIRVSEMLLGRVPTGFAFIPKHKSNAYDTVENG